MVLLEYLLRKRCTNLVFASVDRSVYDDILKITLKLIKNDVDILLEANEVFSCRSMFGPRKTQHFHERDWSTFIDCFDRKMKRKMKNEYS